jgi:hypothetical protein
VSDTKAKWMTAALGALLLGALYLAVHVGAAITPTGHVYSWNFFTLLGDMALRGAPWPPAATGAAIVAAILALAVFVGFMAWLARRAANKRGNVASEGARQRIRAAAPTRRVPAGGTKRGPADRDEEVGTAGLA